jgi:hypothetical protein
MTQQIRTLSFFLIVLTSTSGVQSQTSFKKDFSANLEEVKKFGGGDFIPKFDFENFFKEVDGVSASESPREGCLRIPLFFIPCKMAILK